MNRIVSWALCFFSKNASDEDKELATKLVITYGKTDLDKIYTVNFDEYTLENTKLPSKNDAQKYFI
ncbi:MAG: hypothetical protein U9N30_10780 [Campylobacterota bacterium]|nr:hypothetical protein [Campylobacterota bacterium]